MEELNWDEHSYVVIDETRIRSMLSLDLLFKATYKFKQQKRLG